MKCGFLAPIYKFCYNCLCTWQISIIYTWLYIAIFFTYTGTKGGFLAHIHIFCYVWLCTWHISIMYMWLYMAIYLCHISLCLSHTGTKGLFLVRQMYIYISLNMAVYMACLYYIYVWLYMAIFMSYLSLSHTATQGWYLAYI